MFSYNYENNQNLGAGTKVNDLSSLFREKTETGAQDVNLEHLACYWKETSEKDKKTLIELFKGVVAKEFSNDQTES